MAKEKKYPAEFVARAKSEYPDWPELHKALDANSEFVGRYLDDNSSGGIAPKVVSSMIAKD